jgi:hypothetical protein
VAVASGDNVIVQRMAGDALSAMEMRRTWNKSAEGRAEMRR